MAGHIANPFFQSALSALIRVPLSFFGGSPHTNAPRQRSGREGRICFSNSQPPMASVPDRYALCGQIRRGKRGMICFSSGGNPCKARAWLQRSSWSGVTIQRPPMRCTPNSRHGEGRCRYTEQATRSPIVPSRAVQRGFGWLVPRIQRRSEFTSSTSAVGTSPPASSASRQ